MTAIQHDPNLRMPAVSFDGKRVDCGIIGNAELLPCPWCGQALAGPPTVRETSTFRWRAVNGCCTDGPEVRHDTMADDQAAAELDSRRRAIEAWNTRP